MPSLTPPEKVLGLPLVRMQDHRVSVLVGKLLGREFPGGGHVHMIVKAESEDGCRLHIDKEMLRACGARTSHA